MKKNLTLVTLHKAPQEDVIACGEACIAGRKDNFTKHPEYFGTYAKNETAAAKRFRKGPSYFTGLEVVLETLKAQLFIDIRQTKIEF